MIGAAPFNETRDTTGASTSAADDPILSCGLPDSQNSASVWYQFTAPSNGTVTAKTFTSDYDTVLSAYGGTCAALGSELACSDDDDDQAPQSLVSFAATNGATYLLEVAGYDGNGGGSLHFSLTFGAPGTPTVTATSTRTATVTPTRTATSTPGAVTPTRTATPTITATQTATATRTATVTPAGATPTPTSTPSPTRTCDGHAGWCHSDPDVDAEPDPHCDGDAHGDGHAGWCQSDPDVDAEPDPHCDCDGDAYGDGHAGWCQSDPDVDAEPDPHCDATATRTATVTPAGASPTPTSTPSPTRTATATRTATVTPVASPTPTSTPSPTRTRRDPERDAERDGHPRDGPDVRPPPIPRSRR